MTTRADSLEARLFRHYWDDGLLDLFVGVGVVSIGIFWAFDLVAIGAVLPAMLVPFWTPLRRRLIEPRAGLVEFSDNRNRHNQRLGVRTVLLGFLMLGLFVGSYFIVRSRPVALLSVIVAGVPAFLVGLLVAVTGWGLGLPRFLGYAGLFVVCGLAVALADGRPEWAMMAGGIATVTGGAWRLMQFMSLPEENPEAD